MRVCFTGRFRFRFRFRSHRPEPLDFTVKTSQHALLRAEVESRKSAGVTVSTRIRQFYAYIINRKRRVSCFTSQWLRWCRLQLSRD